MENANAYRTPLAGNELAALFELSPDIIAFIGFDSIIRRVNPAAVTVSGFAESELVGMDFRRLIHPEDLPLVETSLAHLATTGRDLPVEARGIVKSGAAVWYEWHSARIDDSSFLTIGRDISPRKRVELTLSMAGAALGDVSQGYWVHDAATDTIYCSAEAARVLGCGHQAREASPDDLLSLVHDEDRERVAQEITAACANPDCNQHLLHYRVALPDGAVRHVMTNGRFRRDGDGQAVQVVGTVQDITERLVLQATLRREQELSSAIFDNTGAIIVVMDRDGFIVRFNRAAEKLTGYSQNGLKGKVWDVLVPEAARAGVKQAFENLRAGKFPNVFTNAWLTRDGREVQITWSNTALCDASGEVEYVIGSGIDVSDLQQMHSDLVVARQAYRRLLELSFDMVSTQSADGTILDLNSAGARLLGAQSPGEIVGLKLCDIIHPDHYENAMAAMKQTFAVGEQRSVAQAKLKTLDGRYRDVEIVAAITTTWDGQRALQAVIRDITERKLARAAMLAREHYFESLAQVAPTGIFQSDLDGCVVYANRRCTEILGQEQIAGSMWERYVHEWDRQRVLEVWARAVQERQPFSLEFRYQRPDGELIWLRCHAIMERDAAGELGGYIGAITDITPFKAMTEQLLDAERRARRVVDLSFDIIMLIDGEHMVIADINYPGAALLRGRNAADFVGRPMTDFFSSSDHALVMDSVRTALDSWAASAGKECKLLRCDGTALEVEGVAIPVMYQGEAAVYAVFRDITERKAAERALRQREHHFATLAKAAPVGIFQTDVDGRCVYANQRYLAITGYAQDDIQGIDWWEHVVAEDAGTARSHWQKMCENQGSFELEFRLRRRDGRVIWVLGQAVPEPSTSGETLGYIGSITDINQSKLDEIELRNYREHLEDMVRERTVELEAVNRELESFSYSVSHDLRAPLRAINGFNSALLDEYGDKLDDDARFFLRRMQANTRQMAQLIDDLMQLSKVTQTELQREWVDLSAVAETILSELQLADPVRPAEITVMPNLKAYGDPQLLGILMQNLLGNAWKYTGRESQTRIEFGALDVRGARAYYVRDNGVGFDMSCVSHLFRAFQRLHDSSQFEGTGIGLATVHRIVTRHGGRVWAEGEEGNGATFYFVLH